MKNLKHISVATILGLFMACNFNQSVSKDLMTGLTTRGEGLSAKEVYIADGEKKATDNTFLYGQKIYTNFVNMDGFVIENRQFFPEMQVVVVSKAGDTVLRNENMLGGKGLDASLSTLNGHVMLATPIQSGAEYTVAYTVSDTKSDAVFYSELDLKLKKDPNVRIKEEGLWAKETYIFNQDSGTVVTKGEIPFETNMLFDLQGLEGYEVVEGRANLGMSAIVIDADGQVILNRPDLLANRMLTDAEVKKGLASTLKIRKGNVVNPLKWKVEVWDKTNNAKITVEADLDIVD